MCTVPVVASNRAVQLRPTTEADLAFVLAAEQHAENAPFVGHWTHAEHTAALAEGNYAHLVVVRARDGVPVGYVIVQDLVSPRPTVQVRRLVITDKGHGYGRATVRAIKTWAFATLQARFVWLDVMVDNHRAQQLYRSEGFVTIAESWQRAWLPHGGEQCDMLLVMAVLAQAPGSAAGGQGSDGGVQLH